MSDWRKEWLTFDRKDRVAIPFLFFIVFTLIVALNYWDEWTRKEFNENNQKVFLESKKDTAENSFEKKEESSGASQKKKTYNSDYKGKEKINYFSFDPNIISEDSLTLLGFSPKEAKAFVNFRSSGVTFKKPADIKQSFVVTQKDFDRLKDYILLSASNDGGNSNFDNKEKEVKKFQGVIEVNEASAKKLQKIYGIGPTYAERIVKFRDALGGFANKGQLQQVYGLEDSTFQLIKPHVKVDASAVEKININEATKKELSSHPYIAYHIANSLVNYRKQHGDFDQLKEIKNLHLIDDKLYAKIKPYIELQ